MAAVTRRDFLSLSAVAAALGLTALPAAAATAKPTCRTCATPTASATATATPTATPTATATATPTASGITTSAEPLADIRGVMRLDTAAGAALRVSPDGVLHAKALVIHSD